jgi:hypothetical protein
MALGLTAWGRRVGLAAAVALLAFLILSPAPALADGTVSGTVTDSATGAPIPYVYVELNDGSGKQLSATTSAADGAYTLPSAPDGTWYVGFFEYDYEGIYPGISVTITGSHVTGVNAAMVRDGHITGTVTAADGTPVSGIFVQAFGSDGADSSACTAADGSYTLKGLTPGSYRIDFSYSGCHDFVGIDSLEVFYDDKPSYSTADLVSTSDDSTTAGIDAVMPAAGEVSGTVIGAASGNPLPNIEVDAYDSSGRIGLATCTAADGTYALNGLAPGTYRVGFTAGSPTSECGPTLEGNYAPQFYDGEHSLATADPLTLTAGSAKTGVNAAMATGGQITGTVTDAKSHRPLPELEADAYDLSGNLVQWVCVAEDATYDLEALDSGTYKVFFMSDPPRTGNCGGYPYYYGYYRNKSTFASANPVTVESGQTTSDINGTLTQHIPWGAVGGSVTDALTGTAISGATVWVYDSNGTARAQKTDAAGRYGFNLKPGEYRIEVAAPGYVTQFYKDKASLETADQVWVQSSIETTASVALLQRPGKITGTATDAATGAPLPGVNVIASDAAGARSFAVTDSAGAYSLSLTPGTYRVEFDLTGYLYQYYDGASSVLGADPVTVTSKETTADVDAALLKPPGQISGTVTDAATSSPIAGATITVYDSFGKAVASTTTNAGGDYIAQGLQPASYRLGFAAPGYSGQFYSAKTSLAAADPVAVTTGGTRSGIDATLVGLPAAPMPVSPAKPPPTLPPSVSIPRPEITHLAESHKRFRAGAKLAPGRHRRPPTGTTFTFALTEPSTVKLVFARVREGRRVKGKCVAPGRANRHDRRCLRSSPDGTRSYRAKAGAQTVAFTGRLPRHKTLAPGRHELTVTASNLAGRSKPRSIDFAIVK